MTIILDGSTGIVSDSTASNPAMTAKGNGSDVEGYIQLNCRVNSHGVKLKSPPHSSGQSYTMILPDNQVAADKFLKVKSITGSGANAVGQLEYADVAGGKILQVKQFRKTDTFSSSQNGFVDIGVAVDITPVAAGSKILIYAGYSGYTVKGSGGAGKIVRTISGSAQDIGKADASQSRNVSSFSGSLYPGSASNTNLISMNPHTEIEDTPTYSVGDTINYKIQCHPENDWIVINYQYLDENNTANGNRTTSYITCMEIAA